MRGRTQTRRRGESGSAGGCARAEAPKRERGTGTRTRARRRAKASRRARAGAQAADAKRGPPRGCEASSRPAAHAIPPHAPPRRAGRHAKLAKNDDLTTEGGPIAAGFPPRVHGPLSATWENEAARAQARSNGPRFRRQVVIFGHFFQSFVPPHPAKRGGSRSAQPLIRDTPAECAALDFAMARRRRSSPFAGTAVPTSANA